MLGGAALKLEIAVPQAQGIRPRLNKVALLRAISFGTKVAVLGGGYRMPTSPRHPMGIAASAPPNWGRFFVRTILNNRRALWNKRSGQQLPSDETEVDP